MIPPPLPVSLKDYPTPLTLESLPHPTTYCPPPQLFLPIPFPTPPPTNLQSIQALSPDPLYQLY